MRAVIGDRARTWGSTLEERRLEFPCDRHLADYDQALFRAVSVEAPAPVLFRWLCQLRVAPYSYDWIDNLGRRSPRQLTAGLDELEVGQTVIGIFELVEFERDRQITVVLPRAHAVFGELAGTYLIVPRDEGSSRLVVKLLWAYPRPAPVAAAARRLLPFGDMVMMRKQLLTLKELAEQQSAAR